MEFKEYWVLVVEKFSTFRNEDTKITIKVSSLKSLMSQSHDHGVDFGKNLEKYKSMTKPKESWDLFGDLFGGKNK